MSQNEREYYENLMVLDLKDEILKALRIEKKDDGEYDYDEAYNILDSIDSDLEKDIADTRKNIMTTYTLINDLRTNLSQIVALQDNSENKDEYDKIISGTITSCNSLFDQIQDFVNDIDIANATKSYINTIRKEI